MIKSSVCFQYEHVSWLDVNQILIILSKQIDYGFVLEATLVIPSRIFIMGGG